MKDPERAERVRQTLFASLGIILVAVVVVLNVDSHRKYDESARNGDFERASQNSVRQ